MCLRCKCLLLKVYHFGIFCVWFYKAERNWNVLSNKIHHFFMNWWENVNTQVHFALGCMSQPTCVCRASQSCQTAPQAVHQAEQERLHPLHPCARPAAETPCRLCLPATTVLRKCSPATHHPQVSITATCRFFWGGGLCKKRIKSV